MKKRNVVIMAVCAALCFSGVVFIFQKYQSWTDHTLEQLIDQNLKAYTDNQRTEVVARIEKVQASLRTVAELMASSESQGQDPRQYKDYLQAISDNKSIDSGEVAYFRFDELNVEGMRENDQQLINRLKKGESAISDIYPYKKKEKSVSYFGIAEPVEVDGAYIGFVRGLINPTVLLSSNQLGILKDDTESYLIHTDGSNAMLDYFPKDQQVNMLDALEEGGSDHEEVEKLRAAIQDGEQLIVKIIFEDAPRYISYSRLPYNDLLILNISDPVELNTYTETLAENGRRMTLFFFTFAAVMAAGIVAAYYMSNREKRFEKKRTELLVNFSDTILCEYDIKRDIIMCTSNITKLFAIESTSISSFRKYLRQSDFVHPEDLDTFTKLLSIQMEDNQMLNREVRLLGRSGIYIWCWLDIIRMGYKKEDRLVIKVTDISAAKEKELGLLKKVQIDNLTGVLSRGAFEEKVKGQLSELHDGYLVLMDLDNFKEINDVYGHTVGDKCLQKTGEVFGNAFRSVDLFGRYGGDEFFVFLEGKMAKNVVEKRIRRLQELLEDIRIKGSPEIVITCSIGAVECRKGVSYEALLKKADEAMYEAKKEGKNSYIIQ